MRLGVMLERQKAGAQTSIIKKYWLGKEDLNLQCLIQSQVCYHYTIPQRRIQ